MPTYYQDPSQLAAYGGNTDEDDEDLDYGDSDDPASDAAMIQQAQQGNGAAQGGIQGSIPEGPPGNYLSGPDDSDNAVTPDSLVPGMHGVTFRDLSTPAPLEPPAVLPPSEYQKAIAARQALQGSYPVKKAPNWMERVAAGALGGAAGWSNAARRAAPIDIGKVTEGVLYPGYDSKLAAWQSKVIPADQSVQLAGEQAAAGWKGQQIQSETQLKSAQTQMNLDRARMYNSMAANRGRFRVDTKTGQVFDTTTGTFVQHPQTIDDILKTLPPDVPRDQALNYALSVSGGGKYTAPKPVAATHNVSEWQSYLDANGGDSAKALAAKQRDEIARARQSRDPMADVARQELMDRRAQNDLDVIGTSTTAMRNRILDQHNRELSALSSGQRVLPNGVTPESEAARLTKEAADQLQQVQNQYVARGRARGIQVDDFDVVPNPDGSISYRPRNPAPAATVRAPAAAAPQAPIQPSPRPAAQVSAPPPPGPAPIRRYNAQGHGVELRNGAWVPIP